VLTLRTWSINELLITEWTVRLSWQHLHEYSQWAGRTAGVEILFLLFCCYIFFFADFVMTVNLSILKCWLVSFIIYLFICIYLVGWEGACKKSVCVGDLQSVFHKLFICIYLVGWEGTCKKSCLCWRSVRNEDRQLLWRVWAGKVHAKKAVYVGDL